MRPGGFFHERRVAFGECDPARIYYTPRAVDYALEAIEAWFGSVPGVSLADPAGRGGLETSFLRVDCDFLRPLVAGQRFRMRVRIGRIEGERVLFHVDGENGSGDPYFRADLLACFAAREGRLPVPIPPGLRTILESRIEPREDTEKAHGHRVGSPPEEAQRSGEPQFLRRRCVLFGECCPSGTIHPPKVIEHATEAVGEWFEEILGVSWLELVSVRMQGAPMVAVSCDYLSPMVPGGEIVMGILVTRLGKASIGFAVEGRDAGGSPCFDARMVACYIDQRGGFRAMRIPEEHARRIEAYRAACSGARSRKTPGDTEGGAK